MKLSLCVAISLVALGLGGCGKKAEPAPSAEPSARIPIKGERAATEVSANLPTNEGAVAVAVSPEQMFANTAAASDTFELETSMLAARKAASAKVKRFAEQMIKAHTESTAKLKTAAAAANPAITPVPDLTAMQRQMLDALGAKSGADFDTAYVQAQVDAHQGALVGLDAYLANGNAPSLKAFATKLKPVVTAHLNMAKAL